MVATQIVRLDVTPLELPLRAVLAGARMPAVAHNLLVRIELADGTVGLGEAAPSPASSLEDRDRIQAALRVARTLMLGGDARRWRRLAGVLYDQIRSARSARCAVETALLDALARQAGLPLWVQFGGVDTELETSVTIPGGTPEAAGHAAATLAGSGITTMKIHTGGTVPAEVARVAAVRAAAPQARILLDGRGASSADAALELVGALHALGIQPELFIQPVPADDWAGLRQVATWAGLPVAIDDAAETPQDVFRAAQERAAQVVVVKLMRNGVIQALDMAAACRAAGMRLMISTRIESPLATSMAASFAAGIGGFHYVDLDAPLLLEDTPFAGGARLQGGRISLEHIRAGHGVVLAAA